MKTFENPFFALVELRNIGRDVVSAKVSTSLRFDRMDADYISECILDELLPNWVASRRLYDGSYVLVSVDVERCASNLCVTSSSRSLSVICANVELNDGLTHDVRISLDQFDDDRHDHLILDSRSIRLCGKLTVEVPDCGDTDEEEK